ncbi:unnamed protein product [Ectocarpus sp. CCAP 1310/34]|nr:unnamed protein product [Ectocarpus sp. CCAP 1310/34]
MATAPSRQLLIDHLSIAQRALTRGHLDLYANSNCFACLPSVLWVHLAAAHAYQQNQQKTEDGPRRRWVVLLLLYLVAGCSDCDAEVLKRKLLFSLRTSKKF